MLLIPAEPVPGALQEPSWAQPCPGRASSLPLFTLLFEAVSKQWQHSPQDRDKTGFVDTKNNEAVLSSLSAPPLGSQEPLPSGAQPHPRGTCAVQARAPVAQPGAHAVCGEAPEKQQSHLSTFVKRNKSTSGLPTHLPAHGEEGGCGPRGSFHTREESCEFGREELQAVGARAAGLWREGARAGGMWAKHNKATA